MVKDNQVLTKLIEAEEKAFELFDETARRGLIVGGKTEKEVSGEIFDLAKEMFGIDKYWHKRIVRCGENTLCLYDDNPLDLTIKDDDIVFLDLGPIFDEHEADVGRTYVLGDDPAKHKIAADIETAWLEIRDWYFEHTSLTGADVYAYSVKTANKYGWDYGIEIAGHLVGQFPHERLPKGEKGLYFHEDNPNDVFLPAADGSARHWILELQFVDLERKIGSFYEQLLR